jgi:uncharacterized membrane protein YczE
MNTINPSLTEKDLYSMIQNVVGRVDDIYKQTHSRSEYLTYKIGQKTSRFFKFMRSPQVKVINMVMFWAIFVASWIMAAVAYGSVFAFIAFGLIIAIYTDITATAVSAIIKDTMVNYYSGMLKNV